MSLLYTCLFINVAVVCVGRTCIYHDMSLLYTCLYINVTFLFVLAEPVYIIVCVCRGFPTRMVYLYYISCLRYNILVGNPRCYMYMFIYKCDICVGRTCICHYDICLCYIHVYI